jgi:hypothetical protein
MIEPTEQINIIKERDDLVEQIRNSDNIVLNKLIYKNRQEYLNDLALSVRYLIDKCCRKNR